MKCFWWHFAYSNLNINLLEIKLAAHQIAANPTLLEVKLWGESSETPRQGRQKHLKEWKPCFGV